MTKLKKSITILITTIVSLFAAVAVVNAITLWYLDGTTLKPVDPTWGIEVTGVGDVNSVGDCTSGACLDGTSDGGTYIKFYDAQGAVTFQTGNVAGAITLTLPITTGTILNNTDLNTMAELDSLIADANVLSEEEIDASLELLTLMDDKTGTGLLTFATSPTFTTSINLGATGVSVSDDADGAITFLGISGGYDENFTINLDDVENTIGVSSSTGVTGFNFGTIDITAGDINSAGNLYFSVNEMYLSAPNVDDSDYLSFEARDSDTNSIVPVGTLSGAADPYFSLGGASEFKFYNSGYALVTLDKQLRFGDAGVYIFSDDDGHLDLTADTSIDLNGAVASSSTITVGTAGGTTGAISLVGTTSGTVVLTVNAIAGTPTYVLPAAYGAAGTSLTDAAGNGVLSWAAGGTGDVTAVGNCASGLCLDGTSDGGTNILFYDAEGATTLQVGDNAGAVALTLPTTTGTIALTTSTVSAASALAADPTDCGANTFATTIAASGNLTCAAVTYAGISATTSVNWAGLVSDETGSSANGIWVFSDSPVFYDDITIQAAGVKITGADGGLTFLGLGNGYDESFSMDLDNTENKVVVATSTGITTFDFGAIIIDADITGALTGNASTASDLSGCTDCINATEIEDIYLLDDGDIGTGVYDFGGATSLEIPNGGPTIDTLGEIGIDTTSDQFAYMGAAKRILSYQNEICAALETPTDADDNIAFFFPRQAITITDVYCQVDGGTSVAMTISDGTNALEAITCDDDGAEDDGSIANGTFTSLERMEIDLASTSGTNTWLTWCVTYTITSD